MASKKVAEHEIGGVSVVTIPVCDHENLLTKSRQFDIQQVRLKQRAVPGRSLIERNPEIAAFLAESFGIIAVEEILKICRQRFGAVLTPSRSAAYRYWDRLRKSSA